MADLDILDARFQEFVRDLPVLLPEGITRIDLHELHRLGLLRAREEPNHEGASITRYFNVVESDDKITLFNKQYVIWIVPQMVQGRAETFTFVAVQHENDLSLELVYSTSLVYNSSRLVLRVLERYLEEIRETDCLLKSFTEAL